MIKTTRICITFFLAASFSIFNSCTEKKPDLKTETSQIAAMLDSFNRAAARADFQTYFNFYTEDAVFTGTDATERWEKPAFMTWAKPIFDKGRAWDFTSLERHIYFDKTGNLAWFDELLKTQMKICRGSGVVVKKGDDWKVQQYILSAMVPNEVMDSVIPMKTLIEDSLIKIMVGIKSKN